MSLVSTNHRLWSAICGKIHLVALSGVSQIIYSQLCRSQEQISQCFALWNYVPVTAQLLLNYPRRTRQNSRKFILLKAKGFKQIFGNFLKKEKKALHRGRQPKSANLQMWLRIEDEVHENQTPSSQPFDVSPSSTNDISIFFPISLRGWWNFTGELTTHTASSATFTNLGKRCKIVFSEPRKVQFFSGSLRSFCSCFLFPQFLLVKYCSWLEVKATRMTDMSVLHTRVLQDQQS